MKWRKMALKCSGELFPHSAEIRWPEKDTEKISVYEDGKFLATFDFSCLYIGAIHEYRINEAGKGFLYAVHRVNKHGFSTVIMAEYYAKRRT